MKKVKRKCAECGKILYIPYSEDIKRAEKYPVSYRCENCAKGSLVAHHISKTGKIENCNLQIMEISNLFEKFKKGEIPEN